MEPYHFSNTLYLGLYTETKYSFIILKKIRQFLGKGYYRVLQRYGSESKLLKGFYNYYAEYFYTSF